MDFGPYLFLATLEGMVTAAVLALTALGLSLVFGVMRIVNVAHGEFFMLGAVLAWWFASLISGSPALGFLAALVLSPLLVGVIAIAFERTILKRIDYNPEATIVATIGLLYILQQLALTFYGPDARPVQPPINFRVLFPWFGYSGYKLVVVGASIALLIATWFVLTRTRLGLIMRATQYDSETAQAFAIPVGRVYAIVFAIGAMLAATAAVLIVPIQQAHYLMGGDPLLLSFIVVIIGGLGSILGTVVAAVIIGLSDGIISVFFSPTLAKILATLLVALVLVVRPQGLFGESAAMSVTENTQGSAGSPDAATRGSRLFDKVTLLHLAVLAALFAAQFVISDYHNLSFARVMVLATYAVGYNILFGYTGLLSLGHAMFFAAGLYGAGLAATQFSFGAPEAFVAGIAAGLVLSVAVGLVVLRTTGVSFMIVTMMFAQAGYLISLYFGEYTRGDEGIMLSGEIRSASLFGLTLDLTSATVRYNLALALLGICVMICLVLVRSPVGRVLVAIRENEERARMLGYNTYGNKLFALAVSGTIAAAAGAAYALLFAYVGATFASIQYSILPLLWVLLGGIGTVLGPIVGTLLMFYLVDFASEYTSAYMLVVGVALLGLVVWFPKGLLGTLREKAFPWLP